MNNPESAMRKTIALILADMAAVAKALQESAPLLIACLGVEGRRDEDTAMLADVSLRMGGRVRVMVLDDASVPAFSRRYDVLGTPTFLFFDKGLAREQLFGRTDASTLCAFVLEALQRKLTMASVDACLSPED